MVARRIAIVICLLSLTSLLYAQPKGNFAKADSVAGLFSGHSLSNLKLLSDRLTAPLETEVDKFRAIHTWVCENISGDYDLYKRNKKYQIRFADQPARLKAWQRKFSPEVFSKLLEDQATLCTGYAYLLRELAYHAGISCRIINGYGRTPSSNVGEGIVNHSWNLVRLGGEWFVCDPTWSSGRIDARSGKFIRDYNDSYFLADPAIFMRDHYPGHPADSNPSFPLESFLNAPLIHRAAYQYGVIPLDPQNLLAYVNKNDSLHIKFRSRPECRGTVTLLYVKGGTTWEVTPVIKTEAAITRISDILRFRGPLEVHVLINGEPVITYHLM